MIKENILDSTTFGRKKKPNKRHTLRKTPSTEKKEPQNKNPERANKSKSITFEEASIAVGQGAVKKRIRYKQHDRSDRVDESDVENFDKSGEESFSLSNDFMENKEEEILVDAEVLEKVVVPTKSTIVSLENPTNISSEIATENPVTVFVKTTRKLFTPIAGITEIKESSPAPIISQFPRRKLLAENKPEEAITHLPPLPPSPTPQRKLKEISPSIRFMMVKYNQKVAEQEAAGCKSGGSSGSASPVAWISPVMERRVKVQTKRYQEEIKKMSPLSGRKEVKKSASLSLLLHLGNKQLTIHKIEENKEKGVLKSKSVGKIPNDYELKSNNKHLKKEVSSLKLTMPTNSTLAGRKFLDIRAKKIQKAKEDFLNSPLPGPSSAPPQLSSNEVEFLNYPARNRLSQISVGSDTSYESSTCEGWLTKSASAGMINIDPDTYKQFDTTIRGEGYLSLPRTGKKSKSGLFSNITSKFRKVKMRRNRDANKMNTISKLCRQSLVVDINENQDLLEADSRKNSLNVPSVSGGSSSEDTSATNSRSGSWIKRTKTSKT